jgi:hypothetical protein
MYVRSTGRNPPRRSLPQFSPAKTLDVYGRFDEGIDSEE